MKILPTANKNALINEMSQLKKIRKNVRKNDGEVKQDNLDFKNKNVLCEQKLESVQKFGNRK